MNAALALCLGLAVCVLPVNAACAQADVSKAASNSAPTLAEILDQQREIQEALKRNDPQLAHLDSFRRSRIKLNQETVFRRAAGYQSIGEMKADDQLALFNALKRIESLMIKRDEDENMVCERVAIVGTRRYEMACMTRAERDERADGAKKALMERQACTTAGCAGD